MATPPKHTVVLTGANGTMAQSFVKLMLTSHPTCALALTVRNPSKSDPNTAKLLETLALFPNAVTKLYTVDLGSLASVKTFTSTLAGEIAAGALPPISAIVANAFAWSISGGQSLTADGFELSFQVNHLAHFTLVLQLLGSMDAACGRIVLLASDAHFNPSRNSLTVYPCTFPAAGAEETLVHPAPDTPGEEVGRGFQRYAVSKLCVVMCAYALNRRLAQDPALKNITCVAMDPGGMPDSRCMSKDVPKAWTYLMKYILSPLAPVLRRAIPTLRNSSVAAKDMVEVAVGESVKGKRGYFTMAAEDRSTEEAYDEAKQELLWRKSLEWAGIKPADTVLSNAF
ncbi:short-chain dehydrogenase/reductase-like protein sdr [Geopyxis carbonaria]|nr:short-chain dehydrogenase/reductase-like protein sdr [Geopyxis carbonaria]